MKPIISLFSVLAFFALVACGTGDGNQSSPEDEATGAAVKQVEPLSVFENAYAEVVKVSLAPNEALTPHEGDVRLIYSLSDYSISWTEQGKDEGVKSWKKGEVHVHAAGEHAAVNTGSSTAEWLAFVRKTSDLPDCGENSLENDVNSVAEDVATIVFENVDFRVTEVRLPPSGKVPMHSGINRIIYALSDYQINYESDTEGAMEKAFQKGDAHWHEACMHALENTGGTEAFFLVVAYK